MRLPTECLQIGWYKGMELLLEGDLPDQGVEIDYFLLLLETFAVCWYDRGLLEFDWV